MLNLAGLPITAYAAGVFLCALVCAALIMLLAPRHGLKRRWAALYALVAGILSLALGRAVYCAVRYEWIFYDEMGDFAGLSPFLDPANGGVNVAGVLLGCLIAAPITALLTKKKAADYLDCAALPGLLLFALARFLEPLSGQGYGDLMNAPALCFFPLALENDWGEWSLSVCFIEGILALALCTCLCLKKKSPRKSGTLALWALVLLCACQVMPESLRRDDVLFVFIFARVTQIGYALALCGGMGAALLRGKRRGLPGRIIAREGLLTLLGVGVCIGAEFALDKTNWPDALVYAGMIAALAGMAYLICRRIRKEDIA